MERHENAADRRDWMRQTLASARLEGAEFDQGHVALCGRVVDGEVSATEFVEIVISSAREKT